MLKNYIKIAIRNILKYKGFSFINILGLSIGISCCILISLFVLDELSYDKYHKKADQIFRVGLHGIVGTNEINANSTPAPMAAALVQDYPEVITAARFNNFGFPVLRYGEKIFSEEKFFAADSTIFDVFTIPFIKGDPKTALNRPNTLVLTKSMAKKYFGDEDPIGKTLNADNRRDYIITGVVEDVPINSHFKYDFLGSMSSYPQSRNQVWVNNNYNTYFVLQKGITKKEFEPKLDELVVKYVGPQIEKAAGISFKQFLDSGGAYGFFLQALTDIHLHSDLEGELEPNSDIAYVYIFSLIAIAILIIACINFMNLATARSTRRAREVGIRKTLGSVRSQLTRQFLSESIFMSFIAIILAVVIVESVIPQFNILAGKQLSIKYFSNFYIIPLFFIFTILVGIMAGIYPSIFLASFKPVDVLKSSLQKSGKSPWLRSGLVIFQFTISIILFVGTFIVYRQLGYIQNKKLGFNKEQVIVIQKTDDLGDQIEAFKKELLRLPGVMKVSNSTSLPGKNFNSNGHRVAGMTGEETHVLWGLRADHNFIEAYQIQLADGRYFSLDFPTDSTAVVLNETAIKAFGLTDPLGKEIIAMGPTPEQSSTFRIVGVMEDFHFQSLHQEIRPFVIKLFGRNQRGRFVSVRIHPDNIKNIITQLEETWQKFASLQPFEFTFFDQDYAELYDAEQRTGNILTVFSVLAIFVACLGLFGLAAFTAEQKTKEIGIRKVLGASIPEIIIMLSKEFTKWILIANIFAWPIAYYFLNKWLQNFNYQTDIGLWIFPLSALLALMLALITVSYQSIKSALNNPVDSLKYE